MSPRPHDETSPNPDNRGDDPEHSPSKPGEPPEPRAQTEPHFRFASLRPLWNLVAARPGTTSLLWLALALGLTATAPDLTRIAAENHGSVVPEELESVRGLLYTQTAWPDLVPVSNVVIGLRRPGGLRDADHAYAARLQAAVEDAPDRPDNVVRVLGPASDPDVAARLVAPDGETRLVAVPLLSAWAVPRTRITVDWIRQRAEKAEPPPGLEILWTGDALLGIDFLDGIKTTLDRAAVATMIFLMVVLWIVYRSVWLSLIPIATIGLGFLIARGLLGVFGSLGWEVTSFVELFLVVVLFGSGTDLCLFLSWRFAERWDGAADPAPAMVQTLGRSVEAIVSSAGTAILALTLMAFTDFHLFSRTGPSVAFGLAIGLVAALTLCPALLLILARRRPLVFAEFAAARSRGRGKLWNAVGRAVMRRPLVSWAVALAALLPLMVAGFSIDFSNNLFGDLPRSAESRRAMAAIDRAFGPGTTTPWTVVLRSDEDLRDSRGLAAIDEISRLVESRDDVERVRSATQPLGSRDLFERARIGARLARVEDGLRQVETGSDELAEKLDLGAARVRAALGLEALANRLGAAIPKLEAPDRQPQTQPPPPPPPDDRLQPAALDPNPNPNPNPNRPPAESLLSALSRVLGVGAPQPQPAPRPRPDAPADTTPEDPRRELVSELDRAAEGAAAIRAGARLMIEELEALRNDPVARAALDTLLLDARALRDFPEIARSLRAYVSPDGKVARIEIQPKIESFTTEALQRVRRLREQLRAAVADRANPTLEVAVTGNDAVALDLRDLTRHDQRVSWVLVPAGVLAVLMVSIRSLRASLNLVATMVVTYGFALGLTHLVFVAWLGGDNLDWKVAYFLFVLLVAIGVDYNIFLMTRLREEQTTHGLREGIARAIGGTGVLISSAAAITVVSFATFLLSPLASIRQLGFALVVGISVDALLVRPVLMPCGHWLLNQFRADLEEPENPDRPTPARRLPAMPAFAPASALHAVPARPTPTSISGGPRAFDTESAANLRSSSRKGIGGDPHEADTRPAAPSGADRR